MTTENLREFITLAKIGNYAAAAEPLFISEATLSRHIMALEQEIGAPLFDRYPRRIELTELGGVFLPFAQQIVGAEDMCRRSVEHRLARGKSTLSIGFDEALAYYGVGELLAAFRKAHPELIIQITEASTFSLREQVAAGQLQLAYILYDEANRPDTLAYKAYRQDTFAVVMAADHPLAVQDSLLLNKLSGESLLLPPPLTAMYELCMKAFRSAAFEPDSVTTAFLSGYGARELIRSGACLAVMPRQFAELWNDEALAIRDIAPRLTIDTAIVYDPASLGEPGQQYLRFTEELNR